MTSRIKIILLMLILPPYALGCIHLLLPWLKQNGHGTTYFVVALVTGCTILIGSMIYIAIAQHFLPLFRQDRLFKSGISAEGTLVEVTDLGTRVNRRHQFEALVEVRPEGRPSYKIKTQIFPERFMEHWVQPGIPVQVYIDRQDPRKIAVHPQGLGAAGDGTLGNLLSQAAQLQAGNIDVNQFMGDDSLKNIVNQASELQAGNIDINSFMKAMGTAGNHQQFVVDGQTFSQLEDLPPSARAAYEAAMGAMDQAKPPDKSGPTERLEELKKMLDRGLITDDEFQAKKKEILRDM